MNILLCNHYAGSPRHGMEFRPYYLAREWVKMGHRVTIAASSCSHLRVRQPQLSGAVTEERIDGIRYVWLRTSAYAENGPRRAINMFSFLRQLSRHRTAIVGHHAPELVIASSTYPLDIFPAFRMARCYKARLVYEVHDLWPLTPMELGGMSRWHPFIMLLQFAENFAYRRSDWVISMLPNAERHMREHGMAPHKFLHVPNGIDQFDWNSLDQPLPAIHRTAIAEARGAGRFLVGYAGGHGLANALEVLVHAAEQLRPQPVSFLLVGQGPEKQALEQLAKDKKLTNVRFLPPIPKASIPAFLTSMDALYLGWKQHRLYEFGVSPNKLFDYMMAARPVIHSINSGSDLVAESGCGVSCAAESPGAVADATLSLLRRPEVERREMGRSGQDYVRRHHDYSVLARRFLKVAA